VTPDDPRLDLPRRYIDFSTSEGQAVLRDRQAALVDQQRDDLEFARVAGTIFAEGPWDGHVRDVAYLGIKSDARVPLRQVARRWRYEPIHVRLGSKDTYLVPQGPIVVRIELGRDVEGAMIRRPYGHAPVQSDGLVDGQDFYFRSRGDLWQMHIGGDDIVWSPTWFYQEDYGTWPGAGMISTDQAYDFIEKAFALYRSGSASMVKERPNFQSGLTTP